MTSRIRSSSPPAGLRRVALLTVFAFGCATVRVPASTIAETVPVRGSVAEPQVELWLESGGKVSSAESAEASARAKAALESALARVAAPQGDAVLAVRAQGVARTASRRTDQRAAVAGLVIGAVVVVAVVVVALVASRGKGGGSGSARGAAAPARSAVPVRGAPPPGAPLPRAVPRSGPSVAVDVFAGIEVPPPGAPPAQVVSVEPPQGWETPVPTPPWPPASEELATVTLPPPPPLELDRRGFFEGDTLRLELVVVDRRSGAPLWTKVVDGEVDPRDATAVEQLLYDAVADRNGWVPAGAESVPAALR